MPDKPCSVEDCPRFAHARGWCPRHYWRWQKYGSTEIPPVQGPPSRWMTHYGYIHLYIPDHPMANSAGAVYEHRIVMAKMLGRNLYPGEEVHHINGVKDDNRPENLQLWTRSQPTGQRVEDKITWAINLLKQYRPELLNQEG